VQKEIKKKKKVQRRSAREGRPYREIGVLFPQQRKIVPFAARQRFKVEGEILSGSQEGAIREGKHRPPPTRGMSFYEEVQGENCSRPSSLNNQERRRKIFPYNTRRSETGRKKAKDAG